MTFAIVLPDGFQYLAPALLSTVFLLLGQNVMVNKYRKRANISYPQVYADKTQLEGSKDAHLFNCAQRAHQNTLEYIPIVYVVTILGGISFPVFSASACTIWTLSRISYTRGYITGDPQKRNNIPTRVGSIFAIGLLLAATYTAGSYLLEIPKALGLIREVSAIKFNAV